VFRRSRDLRPTFATRRGRRPALRPSDGPVVRDPTSRPVRVPEGRRTRCVRPCGVPHRRRFGSRDPRRLGDPSRPS